MAIAERSRFTREASEQVDQSDLMRPLTAPEQDWKQRINERLLSVLGKWRERTNRTWMRHTWSSSGQILSLIILRTAVIGLALYLWWTGQASAGDVAYVMTAYVVIQGYLRDVGMYIRDLQKAVNDMEELVEIHAQPLGIEDRMGAEPIAIRHGRIEFQNVVFHYRGHHQPLYDGLSVTIGAGEKVGLVGLSGSGKTTFVKLIQRLHDVNGGRILIDGHDIATVTQASLRAQIAIVQQEPILFHRSLAENIAYGRPGATQDEIDGALGLLRPGGGSAPPKGLSSATIQLVTGALRTVDGDLSASEVAERTGIEDWAIVYQSRSGRPDDPWLEPDICDYLRAEQRAGLRAVVICPIGFVADHLEVLYDLDIEYQRRARELGLHLERTESLNAHPLLIDALADLATGAARGRGWVQ